MEENKNISEEVIPTVEETVTEETQVVAEAPVVEAAPAIEEVIEEAPASKKVVAPVVAAPAADFDWDAYEKGITLSASAKEDLEKIYDNTLNAIKDKEVVEGTVISINKREVVVNVGYNELNFTLASAVRNYQLTFAATLLRSTSHAANSSRRLAMFSIVRDKHCLVITFRSISAMSSQFPCLGV